MRAAIYRIRQAFKEFGISISDHQWAKIKALSLTCWIDQDNIFVSGDYECSKPDPGIFKIAEQKLQIPGSDIIFVGDSYPNDVVGAKRAGMRCIWFNRRKYELSEYELHKPDYIVADDAALLQFTINEMKVVDVNVFKMEITVIVGA